MKHYSIGQFAKLIGRTPQTLRDWDKKGEFKPHYVAPSGHRYYSQEQLNHFLGIRGVKPERKVIGYCRVSSSKQKDDLSRQVDNMRTYLLAQGNPFEVITDIGSGINYKNKGLLSLIDLISQNQVEKVVVLSKDRLVRFGYELIEYVASLHNCTIEIIDTTEKTEEQELIEDMIQIVSILSAKLPGKRANKAKKMIKELMEDDSIEKS